MGGSLLLIDYNQKSKIFGRETVDYFPLYFAKMAMTAILKQTHGRSHSRADSLCVHAIGATAPILTLD
jgi:hypothetical protein